MMLQRPQHLRVLKHPGMLPQAQDELRVGFHPPLPPTPLRLGPKRAPTAPAHPWGLGAPSPVVLLVHEMVPRSERHQPRVVRRGGDGDGAGAAHVGVAQLVREDLQLIRGEPVVIPQHVVVGRSARALRGRGDRVRGVTSHPHQSPPDQSRQPGQERCLQFLNVRTQRAQAPRGWKALRTEVQSGTNAAAPCQGAAPRTAPAPCRTGQLPAVLAGAREAKKPPWRKQLWIKRVQFFQFGF